MRWRNSKLLVSYRGLNQGFRQLLLRVRKSEYRRLLNAKRRLAVKEFLTGDECLELGRLNWKLGSGPLYRYTPEERILQREFARRWREKLEDERDERKHLDSACS